MKGKLVLIPIPLADCSLNYSIPSEIFTIVSKLNYFIVENIKTARRYIRKIDKDKNIDDITFFVLNKHTDEKEISNFLEPLKNGMNVGIISEAGVPGVADPGANIVNLAHEKNFQVIPLTGPSSIILSVMASGLNGQNFAFNGYLPIKENHRKNKIKQLEKKSKTENQTQIFMETPYRNDKLLANILEECQENTMLCIASNITAPDEFIKTRKIIEWKKNIPELKKKPTIFLIHSY
jgi:16S rRNA (cytidine1402-2'-O)-methyltransferase